MQEMYPHAKPGSASLPVCSMSFKRKNGSLMEWYKKYLCLLPRCFCIKKFLAVTIKLLFEYFRRFKEHSKSWITFSFFSPLKDYIIFLCLHFVQVRPFYVTKFFAIWLICKKNCTLSFWMPFPQSIFHAAKGILSFLYCNEEMWL